MDISFFRSPISAKVCSWPSGMNTQSHWKSRSPRGSNATVPRISPHDYKLDFDEDEAFLAIVSVSAFTKVLVDQIVEALSYAQVSKDLQSRGHPISEANIQTNPLEERIVQRLLAFANAYISSVPELNLNSERHLVGAIAAFINKEEPSANVNVEQRIEEEQNRHFFADIVITEGTKAVIMEVKSHDDHEAIQNGALRLGRYMDALKTNVGILFAFGGRVDTYEDTPIKPKDGRSIHVIATKPQPISDK